MYSEVLVYQESTTLLSFCMEMVCVQGGVGVGIRREAEGWCTWTYWYYWELSIMEQSPVECHKTKVEGQRQPRNK